MLKKIGGIILAIVGAIALTVVALHRHEPVNALWIVTAAGHPPSGDFVAAATSLLTAPNSTQTSSMFRDMRQGSPIEADQIIGDLLAHGEQAGIQAPLLGAAYARMVIYQHRVSAR